MKKLILLIIVSSVYCCNNSNPNRTTDAVVEAQTIKNVKGKIADSTFLEHKFYVPIYSDIYQKSRSERTLLTATLSIRNTSEKDSLYLKRVDYFNTNGDLVRSYLDNDIFLYPMETIDYVIEERDTLGGSGANFIIEWYGKEHLQPVFQAVMIGGLAQRVFAFTTEGTPVIE